MNNIDWTKQHCGEHQSEYHEWIRNALDLDINAPYRFDFYASEIEKLKAELEQLRNDDDDDLYNILFNKEINND